MCVDVNRQYAWLCSPSSLLSALTVRTLRFDLEMKRNEGPLRVSLEKLFYILVPFRLVWWDLDCTGQWAITIMVTSLFEPDTKRPVQLQVAAKDTWQKDIRRSHLFNTGQTVVNKVCAGSRWNRSTISPLLRLLLTNNAPTAPSHSDSPHSRKQWYAFHYHLHYHVITHHRWS